jgi:hypothetical protein
LWRQVPILETTPSKPSFASVLQDEFAITCLMAIELKAGLVRDQRLKQRLALDKRQARDVPAIEGRRSKAY